METFLPAYQNREEIEFMDYLIEKKKYIRINPNRPVM